MDIWKDKTKPVVLKILKGKPSFLRGKTLVFSGLISYWQGFSLVFSTFFFFQNAWSTFVCPALNDFIYPDTYEILYAHFNDSKDYIYTAAFCFW